MPKHAERHLVADDVTTAARAYIATWQNAVGYPTTGAWHAALRPLMTKAGYRKLTLPAVAGATTGEVHRVAQAHGWQVSSRVDCGYHPDAGAPSNDRAMLLCRATARTLDRRGRLVPVSELPWLWPHDGPQEARVLYLRAEQGRWLVADDQTGQAG